MTEASYLSVFLVGLLGGVHCAGMCGGIVGALALQSPGARGRWGYHLAYNAGRIGSYAVAGLLAGAAGAGGMLLQGAFPVQKTLHILANVMLVLLGLYLAGMWQVVARLERVGAILWRHIQPVAQRFLPLDSPPKALALGALWGWLPCGLVYSVLLTALASGSAARGGLTMLAFGAGTLPNLLTLGLLAGRWGAALHRRPVRMAAGLTVAGFGIWGLLRAGHLAFIPGLGVFCQVPPQ